VPGSLLETTQTPDISV